MQAMIDLKKLREDPDHFERGARAKGSNVDIKRLLELDEIRRELMVEQEARRAEQKRISKEMGPELGKRKGMLKKAEGDEKARLEAEIAELEARPAALKAEIHAFDEKIADVEPEWRALHLAIPQPASDDVPVGASSDDNVELSRWSPEGFDPDQLNIAVSSNATLGHCLEHAINAALDHRGTPPADGCAGGDCRR